MTKIIQIRGMSGAGKTTLARSFINKYGLKKGELFTLPVMVNDQYLFLGDYTVKGCAGPDRIQPIEKILITVNKIYDTNRYKYIFFEHKLLSTTTRSVLKVVAHCGKENFGVVVLDTDFNDIVNHIYLRNGGKQINIENQFNGYKSVKRTAVNLKNMGITVRRYNPYNYDSKGMYELLLDFMHDWS